nr:hypothetical protein [uncultured Blautia sp.]
MDESLVKAVIQNYGAVQKECGKYTNQNMYFVNVAKHKKKNIYCFE